MADSPIPRYAGLLASMSDDMRQRYLRGDWPEVTPEMASAAAFIRAEVPAFVCDSAMNPAIVAERERCAKIAESLEIPEHLTGDTLGRMLGRSVLLTTRKEIAQRIRSGK